MGSSDGSLRAPKSTTEKQIKENFDVFDWSIPDDSLAKFSEIPQAKYSSAAIRLHVLVILIKPCFGLLSKTTDYSELSLRVTLRFLISLNFAFTIVVHMRLIWGTDFIHETKSPYKTLEDLWDGEI